MKLFGRTDIGKVRSTNEDCFVTGKTFDNICYAVVCDGMGGASAGDKASRLTCDMIKTLIDNMLKKGMSDSSVKNMLVSITLAVNAKVYEMANSDKSLMGMGTTLVLALAIGNAAHIVHVGDSRAYLIRDGEINKLTKDHSFVQSMVDLGRITDDEAFRHPQRNYITRAIGVDRNLKVDYNIVRLEPEDKLFLCTDGFSNYFTDRDIYFMIQNDDYEIEKAVNNMIDEANQRGGSDNITAVIIENS